MRKPRINAYISHKVDKCLSDVAARTGGSKAAIVDAALSAFLALDEERRHETAILKRLDRIDERLDRIEQDLLITSETLALFIQYFLTVIPPVSERDRPAVQAKGRDRFERFLGQVAKRIASRRITVRELLDAHRPTREQTNP